MGQKEYRPRLQNEFTANMIGIPRDAIVMPDPGDAGGLTAFICQIAVIEALERQGFLVMPPVNSEQAQRRAASRRG